MADALAASGWQAAQYETRFLAARTALDLGMREEAERLLKQVSRRRSRGPADIRILGWQAHALHALSEGRIAAAERALTAGLRVHAEHSAILGATELRVYAAGQGHDLAALGVRLAIEHRDARALLRWAEAQRATSLRRRPVRPPDDAQTGDDLAALRRISAQMVEATTREKGLSGRRAGRAKLNAERLRLEAAVRDRTRYARGEYAPDPPFSAAALVAALGERVLVEFVRVDDVLYAVTVAGGAVRRHRLGSYSQVLKHLDSLRFSMSRLAWKFSSPTLWSAATATFDHSRQTLDALLFVELRAVVGTDASGDLVIVPTGSLHALPWGTLPTCASRAVTIAPSARLWMAAAEAAAEAETVGRQPDRTALIAGPGLDHAGPEIDALAPLYPHATVLTGPTATASAVAKALDGADLAHIATHGRFRADHPLFSSFDTYDGPLFAYDLERLAAAPRVLVLSACESALSGVRAGDELMGLASSMFTLGARTIISSIVPVDDDETRTVMLEFHRALADLPPAAALAKAMSRTGIEGWVCLGYGG
ncbi:MAG: CHAT domain-containing protein [Catenulispora sp.]|nr:CHAT domain-containing protein [Catenulispora sp.]